MGWRFLARLQACSFHALGFDMGVWLGFSLGPTRPKPQNRKKLARRCCMWLLGSNKVTWVQGIQFKAKRVASGELWAGGKGLLPKL